MMDVEGQGTSPALDERNIDVVERDPNNINDFLKVGHVFCFSWVTYNFGCCFFSFLNHPQTIAIAIPS